MKTVGKALHPVVWNTIGVAVFLFALSTFRWSPVFRSEEMPAGYGTGTQDDDTVTTLISSLWSTDSGVRTNSEKKLIAFAQTSAPKRVVVVNKLLSLVNAEKELDGTHNVLETSFLFWAECHQYFR